MWEPLYREAFPRVSRPRSPAAPRQPPPSDPTPIGVGLGLSHRHGRQRGVGHRLPEGQQRPVPPVRVLLVAHVIRVVVPLLHLGDEVGVVFLLLPRGHHRHVKVVPDLVAVVGPGGDWHSRRAPDHSGKCQIGPVRGH